VGHYDRTPPTFLTVPPRTKRHSKAGDTSFYFYFTTSAPLLAGGPAFSESKTSYNYAVAHLWDQVPASNMMTLNTSYQSMVKATT